MQYLGSISVHPVYQVRQVPAVVAGLAFVNAGKKDVKGFNISYVPVYFLLLLRNACTPHGLVRRILYQGALYFRYRMYGQCLACLLAIDVQTFIHLFNKHMCSGIAVRSTWHCIIAAVITDGIVLAYGVFLHLHLWRLWRSVVWLQIHFLFLEDVRRYAAYSMVHTAVSRALQPCQTLLVEIVHVCKRASSQEVVFHVLDCVFHLAFALRVRLAAEDRLKMQLIYKGPESFGQDQVSQILVVQQDLVLVVEQFPFKTNDSSIALSPDISDISVC
jgi:hypothetical protein